MPIPVGNTAPTYLVSLADLKNHLRYDPSNTADDVELQNLIDAITPVVQQITGPILPAVYSEWHDGGKDSVVLMRRPVVSVESVVEYQGTVQYVLTEQSPDANVALDAFGFFVNYDEGWIQRTAYGMPSWFAALPWWAAKTPGWFVASPARSGLGTGRVKVEYTAGVGDVIPPNVVYGTKELARINWRPSQGGNQPGMSGGSEDDFAGTMFMGFFIPNRVRELLLPNEQPAGQIG